MPGPIHLSEEDMRRIEAEELAALRAVQARETEAARRLAAHAYRQEVRSALRPRPFWWPARWVLPFVPVLALAVFFALRPAPPANLDDVTGGISHAALIDWCRDEVRARLPGPPLSFPTRQDAAAQISASADGKRWDGWAQSAGQRTDFSCTFTAAEGSVQVELIQDQGP